MLKNKYGFSLEEFKASFSEHPEWINEKDDICRMLLFLAVENKKLDIVKYLVEKRRIPIDWKDGMGSTLLHHAAARYGNLEFLQWLVEEQHLDVNSTNDEGKTPLDLLKSCIKGFLEKYDFLTRHGATLSK